MNGDEKCKRTPICIDICETDKLQCVESDKIQSANDGRKKKRNLFNEITSDLHRCMPINVCVAPTAMVAKTIVDD